MQPTEEQLRNRLIGAGLSPTSPGGVIAPVAPTTLGGTNTQPTNGVVLPTPKPDYTNLQGIINNALTTVGEIQKSFDSLTKENTKTQDTTSKQSFYESILKDFKPPEAPTSGATDYSATYKDIISPLQADLNAKAEMTKTARDRLGVINAQLGGLSAEAQAVPIQLQEEFAGRNVTAGGLAPIQAGELRKVALRALPLQAQALGVQAEVAAAQGDQQLAQDLMTQATTHLDKLFTLKQQDLQNKFEYDLKVYDSIRDILTKAEERRLDALVQEKQNKFTTDLEGIRQANDLEKIRLQNSLSTTTGGSELLSVTEAQALGVPYGTTRTQATGLGITPTKPATAAQETTALYANRIEQANAILSKLDDKIAGMNSFSYATQNALPGVLNAFKSGDVQSVSQAQRNFVNAVLRRESGAAISPSEFESARLQYFAMPGDTPETLAQKKANRDMVQQGFISGAGAAYSPLITAPLTIPKGTDGSSYGHPGYISDGTQWVLK